MASPKIECISSPAVVGEAPHWDHTQQVLYYLDIPSAEIRKYNPATNKETKAKIDKGPVSLIVPVEGTKDKFVITMCRDLAIITWDGESDKPSHVEKITTVDHEEGKCDINRFNDGKCDGAGRLWAGTLGIEGLLTVIPNKGSLYSLSKDKTTTAHVSDLTCSNGMAWSPCNKVMYFTDSFTLKVDAFDFDVEKGQISNRRTAFDFKANDVKGFPDGMAVDAEGKLWIACFRGGQVIRVDPSSGKLLQSVAIPVENTTSVAFGGPNLDELYVTTASVGMTEEEIKANPQAGCMFRVTGTGVKGLSGQAVIL